METLNTFDKAFKSFSKIKKPSPLWVEELRKSCKARYLETGLPSLRDENWKYTSLRNLSKNAFDWDSSLESPPSNYRQFFVENACNVVLVNGHLNENKQLPQHVSLCTLEEAFQTFPDLIKESLSARYRKNAFTDLNNAFLSKGIFVHVPISACVEKALHIIHFITGHKSSRSIHARNLIYIGKNAQLSLMETIVYIDGDSKSTSTFTNTITDMILCEDARMSYSKFQKMDSTHFYMGHTRLYQKARSKSFCFFELGQADLAREGVHAHLAEDASETHLNGVFHTRKNEQVDFSVFIDHAASYTKSRQYFKGVAEDQSRGVFNAHIKVAEGLHKIDAHQLTKNLLLGAEAEIDAKPHLEIESDDVKCAHGAAIGRMREDEVFYLQTRGIPRSKAENILSNAFTEELVMEIADETLRFNIRNHRLNLNSLFNEKATI